MRGLLFEPEHSRLKGDICAGRQYAGCARVRQPAAASAFGCESGLFILGTELTADRKTSVCRRDMGFVRTFFVMVECRSR